MSEAVHGLDVRALADQEFHEVGYSLIRGRVERSPAELSGGIHVGAVVHQVFRRLERHRALFDRSRALHVGGGADANISGVVPCEVAMSGFPPASTISLDGVEVVDLRGKCDRRFAPSNSTSSRARTVGFS